MIKSRQLVNSNYCSNYENTLLQVYDKFMNFYKTTNPKEYGLYFYKQIGLHCTFDHPDEQIWTNTDVGTIHIYGSLDEIQCGTGDYTIPADLLAGFDYESAFLHFGIIYEGITYSFVKRKLSPMSHPSTFLALEQSAGGINCWKKGQHFRGIEVSIRLQYLKEYLLPFLGYSKDALDFIKPNVRYHNLSQELREILSKIELLLTQRSMTVALQHALCLEFLAYLLGKKSDCLSEFHSDNDTRYIHIGNRKIKMTQVDFEKVRKVHDQIEKDAGSFITIYELSQTFEISEQKLKAGFLELYQQTIWNYANNLRMNQAARLLCDTDCNINEIAIKVGYQSPAAFSNMFKNWCGLTPGQFRTQISEDA